MNEYLTKPLDKKLLLSMVHKCATTVPVLHPNINRIFNSTPDSEIGNPPDNISWSREPRRSSQTRQETPSPDGRRPTAQGAVLRANTTPA
jgi:hypothetical protein